MTLNKSTRFAIKTFYIIVLSMYFISLMIVSCCAELFADYTTAFFWFNEVMNAANRVLFIGVAVCFAIQWLEGK